MRASCAPVASEVLVRVRASASKAAFVTWLGADEVIDYAARDFADSVGDVDVVLEVIARRRTSRRHPPLAERWC
jgi:NADPH:quinone reductase-like Zn-dependent oxidoreductase